jgi:hypothetical protein
MQVKKDKKQSNGHGLHPFAAIEGGHGEEQVSVIF